MVAGKDKQDKQDKKVNVSKRGTKAQKGANAQQSVTEDKVTRVHKGERQRESKKAGTTIATDNGKLPMPPSSLAPLLSANRQMPLRYQIVKIPPHHTLYQQTCEWLAGFVLAAASHHGGMVADVDPEYLHQYRVNLRKARSVVSLLDGAFDKTDTEILKRQLADLMKLSGHLRDLDVYLLAKTEVLAQLPVCLRQSGERLFSHIALLREREKQRVMAQLSQEAFEEVVAPLLKNLQKTRWHQGKAAKHNAIAVVATRLIRQIGKTQRIAQAIDAQSSVEQVHQLRIACKKLRYLTELLLPSANSVAMRQFVKALKQMTESLGEFNDGCVQMAFLQRQAEDTALAPTIALAIGALILRAEERQHHARSHVEQRIDALLIALSSSKLHAELRVLMGQ
uniref:CHAD domain-containing protein n=1 Tax=Thaumasiovibrio occultus TaxID=1891184 RepID=UPI000B358415|nr:CHAD domain-containing protein [Thaumasiovibrio occultus]